MRFSVQVEAIVTYTCDLTEEESQKVQELAEECDYSLEEAVMSLYNSNEIDLYKHSTESDFSTNEITQVIKESE